MSRGWAPLPLAANDPPPEGRAAGAGDGAGAGAQRDGETGEGAGVGGEGKRLKFLTWNVLCDGLSGAHPTRGGFLKAPEGSLDWDKRRCEGSRRRNATDAISHRLSRRSD